MTKLFDSSQTNLIISIHQKKKTTVIENFFTLFIQKYFDKQILSNCSVICTD